VCALCVRCVCPACAAVWSDPCRGSWLWTISCFIWQAIWSDPCRGSWLWAHLEGHLERPLSRIAAFHHFIIFWQGHLERPLSRIVALGHFMIHPMVLSSTRNALPTSKWSWRLRQSSTLVHKTSLLELRGAKCANVSRFCTPTLEAFGLKMLTSPTRELHSGASPTPERHFGTHPDQMGCFKVCNCRQFANLAVPARLQWGSRLRETHLQLEIDALVYAGAPFGLFGGPPEPKSGGCLRLWGASLDPIEASNGAPACAR
jgi:hypothetical protein